MSLKRQIVATALLALVLTLGISCRSVAPLTPADLSSPGWSVHQGQAVWKPSSTRPELAGDLLLAANVDGDYVVRFSKTPFDLAGAQVAHGGWQIEFAGGTHSWSGHGSPPARFCWFQLPRALAGKKPDAPWTFTRRTDNTWRLENPRTGEALEGVFFQ